MAIEGRPEKADMRHGPLRQRQLIEVILRVRRKDVDMLAKAGRCVLQDCYVVQHVLNPRLDLWGHRVSFGVRPDGLLTAHS